MRTELTDPKPVTCVKRPNAPRDISNATIGTTFFAHVTDLKQYGALVFDAGKSTAWLEAKLVNAGLFSSVQIDESSARCLALSGEAIVESGGLQYHKVKANVRVPETH